MRLHEIANTGSQPGEQNGETQKGGGGGEQGAGQPENPFPSPPDDCTLQMQKGETRIP